MAGAKMLCLMPVMLLTGIKSAPTEAATLLRLQHARLVYLVVRYLVVRAETSGERTVIVRAM